MYSYFYILRRTRKVGAVCEANFSDKQFRVPKNSKQLGTPDLSGAIRSKLLQTKIYYILLVYRFKRTNYHCEVKPKQLLVSGSLCHFRKKIFLINFVQKMKLFEFEKRVFHQWMSHSCYRFTDIKSVLLSSSWQQASCYKRNFEKISQKL